MTLAIGLTIALSGCTSGGPPADGPDPALRGTWHLAAGNDEGQGIPVGANSITLRIGDAAHTGGTEPCSDYRARVTGAIGPVYIRASITSNTRDDCTSAGLTLLEQLYIGALTTTSFAAIDNGTLVLRSAVSSLVYVRQPPVAVDNLLLSHWTLFAVSGQQSTAATDARVREVRLRFDGSLGLTVSSPCEATSAVYEIARDNFSVANFVTQQLHSTNCTTQERSITTQTVSRLGGPLRATVSPASAGTPATLVITNLDDGLAVVWRATN